MTTTQKGVNREAIRILVADIGYNETAKRIGVKPATLRKWAERGKWNTPTRTDQRVTLVTTSPATVHADYLREAKVKTKANLAKYSAEASRDAAEHPEKLQIARAVRDVAAVSESVWPEEASDRGILNLNVLAGGKALVQVASVKAEPKPLDEGRNTDSEGS